jgi:hypothetical protein
VFDWGGRGRRRWLGLIKRLANGVVGSDVEIGK